MITFDDSKEEVIFRLNAPITSLARWRHLGRFLADLGPTSRRPMPNIYRQPEAQPEPIAVSDRTLKRVGQKLDEEVIDMIDDPASRDTAKGVLSAINTHIELVPEPA